VELKIFFIKKFYNPNYFERIKTNRILEQNYKKYYDRNVGYNFPIKDNAEFFDKLYDKFLSECAKIYGQYTIHPNNKRTCYCYRSNVNDNVYKRHNHVNTSVINGVYYYQVSKGDSVSFFLGNEEYVIYPENGELLLFPNFLDHSPNPTESKRNRYSINMELVTYQNYEQLVG